MPNWCHNTIEISGPAVKVALLWKTIEEKNGLLEALVPPPDNMFKGNIGEAERKECAKQGIPNWYDWQTANWGTKWEVSIEGLSYNQGRIVGTFDSAWGPPTEAMETFTRKHEEFSIYMHWHEPGMGFAGSKSF